MEGAEQREIMCAGEAARVGVVGRKRQGWQVWDARFGFSSSCSALFR